MNKDWNTDSKLVHAGHEQNEFGSVVTPVWQSSVFAFRELSPDNDLFDAESENYVYTRLSNPTVRAFERAMAELEGGYAAVATASGMAAVNTVFFALCKQGSHVVCAQNVYGSTRAVLEQDWARFGVDVDFVDATRPELLSKAVRSNTAIVYIETPSNPGLHITDIRQAAETAHAAGALLVADNTFAGPIFQNPLKLGADVVLHSVTKYINGHSDVVGGVVVAGSPELYPKLHHAMMHLGGNMDPHQAFLVHRGLKTLSLRMRKAEQNALCIAQFLQKQNTVGKVYYPGLTSHPGHAVAKQQMKGFSSVLSFEIKGGSAAALRLMKSLQLIKPAVSLGGAETFIQHPASMTHSSIPKAERLKAGITDELIRLAVGIEDSQDLLDDLGRGFSKV